MQSSQLPYGLQYGLDPPEDQVVINLSIDTLLTVMFVSIHTFHPSSLMRIIQAPKNPKNKLKTQPKSSNSHTQMPRKSNNMPAEIKKNAK
jgi:hypothetical protein